MINEILITLNLFLLIAILLVMVFKFAPKKSKNFETIKEIKNQVLEEEKEIVEPESKIIDYVGTPKSKKYHKIECRLVKQIKEPEYASKKEFIKKGYRPCGICCLDD